MKCQLVGTTGMNIKMNDMYVRKIGKMGDKSVNQMRINANRGHQCIVLIILCCLVTSITVHANT